uniref:LAGLIDADG endonuclease n=1 Tax=Peronospora matthiolae TaxID=2874970 RepID=A0AAV1T7P4_9STRA
MSTRYYVSLNGNKGMRTKINDKSRSSFGNGIGFGFGLWSIGSNGIITKYQLVPALFSSVQVSPT